MVIISFTILNALQFAINEMPPVSSALSLTSLDCETLFGQSIIIFRQRTIIKNSSNKIVCCCMLVVKTRCRKIDRYYIRSYKHQPIKTHLGAYQHPLHATSSLRQHNHFDCSFFVVVVVVVAVHLLLSLFFLLQFLVHCFFVLMPQPKCRNSTNNQFYLVNQKLSQKFS